ncbi:histidinol-phosphate aminotransferase [Alteribacillus persepolensis]|uniref:Histidinol-phosphate aminotransferase n=1 Tax=Alteribacillus persepolensis TaxID=568899 RepID=A0A1G7ZF43_9BACI|nr:histidinol-phosphate transaminase [Alteribacillus persepolensis]SDH07361.1 histidinol-phosphate aminotransferase [Alteribacillus persepolensis]
MKVKSQIIGMEPYKPGKPMEEVKRELGLKEVHKLASNENPYGASPKAKAAVQQAVLYPEIYPDGYAADIRQAVADHIGVKASQLLFGAGSDEVILMLCRAMLNNETNTVMASPTFSQYKHNAVIEGAEIREVPLKDGVHDLEGMLEQIDENTRIVWVCNPNNPTGTYVNDEAFQAFMRQVPENVLVVSDEAYIEYVTAQDYPNTLAYLNEYPNLMILRTFSKAYGLASMRIGYGVAQEKLVQSLDPVRPPFNTNTIAQYAAIAALGDEEYIEECRIKNRKELDRLERYCEKKGLSYLPSQTNFMLIQTGVSGDVMFDALLKKGFIIRSGEALGYPDWIRVTAGTSEQNTCFLQALEECLDEQKHSVKG